MNGWSRIYLGMHFAGDILCGFAIGAFWASFIHGLLRWLRIFDGNFR
jgi:membrane-associated phospholipid phosphatase